MSKVLASGNVRVLLHTNPPIPASFHWLLKVVAAGKPYCLCADPHYTTTSFFSSFSFPFLSPSHHIYGQYRPSYPHRLPSPCDRTAFRITCGTAMCCEQVRPHRSGDPMAGSCSSFFFFRPRRWLTYTFATFSLIFLNDFIGFQPLTGSEQEQH